MYVNRCIIVVNIYKNVYIVENDMRDANYHEDKTNKWIILANIRYYRVDATVHIQVTF